MNIEETLAAILATLQEIRDQHKTITLTTGMAQSSTTTEPAEPEEDESEDAKRDKLRKILGQVMSDVSEEAATKLLAKFKVTSCSKVPAAKLDAAITAAESLL